MKPVRPGVLDGLRALFPRWQRVEAWLTSDDSRLVVKLEIDKEVLHAETTWNPGRFVAELAERPDAFARQLEHRRRCRALAYHRRRRCCR